MKRTPYTLEECLDILDWFNDPETDFLTHIYLSKIDAEECLGRILPQLRRRARKYIHAYAGTDCAYPEVLFHQAT